jgi:hypothetical protein
MGFATRGFLLVQLSVLLLSFFSVFGLIPVDPPRHPPSHPPIHPPSHPPAHPPSHPPAHPPSHPPAHPPVRPPVHPPVKPPAHPPVKPPVHPPVKPPVKPPAHPPVKPPAHPPVKPPTHPPAHPPVHTPSYPPIPRFPRSFVAVEGVVYCKSCKYAGVDTLFGASPVSGLFKLLKLSEDMVFLTLFYFFLKKHNYMVFFFKTGTTTLHFLSNISNFKKYYIINL